MHLMYLFSFRQGSDPSHMSATLRGELDWIVMKALEKDRSRRYESASAFASDVQRYLSDEPVLACPPSTLYRFQKFARKHRTALAASVAIAISLIFGTTVSAWQAVRATTAEAQANTNEQKAKEAAAAEAQQRQRAEANEQKANANATQAQVSAQDAKNQAQVAATQRDEAKALNDKLLATQQDLRSTLYAAHMKLADNAWNAGGPKRVEELLQQHRPKPGETDLRGFEWYYLNRLCHQELLTLKGHTGRVSSVAYSADAKRLATASYDKTLKVWDAGKGQATLTLQLNQASNCVAITPNGTHVASASSDTTNKTGTVNVWDAQTGEIVAIFKKDINEVFEGLGFSPDGKRLATGSGTSDEKGYYAGTVKVWDVRTGAELLAMKGHTNMVWSVVFSPDGNRLASGSWDGAVKVWDATTGQEILTFKGHTDEVYSVVFSPDGKRLASACSDKDHTVKVWDAQTGTELLTIKGGGYPSVAFSRDGKHLAGVDHKVVKVWDAQTGQELLSFHGHDAAVQSVAFSSDGIRLVSASDDQTVKVWDAQSVVKPPTLKAGGPVRTVDFSADGKQLVSAIARWSNREQAWVAGEVKVWDAQSLKELHTFNGHAGAISNVAASPDGKLIACAPDDKTVRVWDVKTGQELVICKGQTDTVISVAFSPDGIRLAGASLGGMVKVWDDQTAAELLTVKGGHGVLVFSPDGNRLANCLQASRRSTTESNQVKVWNVQTGEELISLQGAAQCVVFSPDGKRLATGTRLPNQNGPPGLGQVVKVWDAQTGQELITCSGHTGGVNSLAYSPDGKRLASASGDKTIKIWDARTGQELLSLEGCSGFMGGGNTVAFSADGHLLAGAGTDGTVKIYDATPLPEQP